MKGAIQLEHCPNYMLRKSTRITCRCGECAVCGYQKHTAIHGPVNDEGSGSKPFGHEFKPRELESEKS